MKRFLVLLCCCLFWAAGSAVLANDGAAPYKKRCGGCHGRDGRLTPGGSAPLKGMAADALRVRLEGYAAGTLGGPAGKPMQDAARKLPREERDLVIAYIGSL
ncbi:MAG: c-type cytochrome [Desulfovibrio sp.]|nr:c-type cytochrome [Desulfovibrio sp.]